MLDALVKPPRVGRGLPAFSLIGSAASGKTTLAKRLAYDLASRGNPVFWLRRTFYPNVQGLLAQFFEVIGETFDKRGRIFSSWMILSAWALLRCRESLLRPKHMGSKPLSSLSLARLTGGHMSPRR